MPKHKYGCMRKLLADQTRQKREVIILDENDRVFGINLFAGCTRKSLINDLIVMPIQ